MAQPAALVACRRGRGAARRPTEGCAHVGTCHRTDHVAMPFRRSRQTVSTDFRHPRSYDRLRSGGELRQMSDLQIRHRDRHALREGYSPAVRRFEIASIVAFAAVMLWLLVEIAP